MVYVVGNNHGNSCYKWIPCPNNRWEEIGADNADKTKEK